MDSNALAEMLNEALMDEYKARDTYQRIIDTFGPGRGRGGLDEAATLAGKRVFGSILFQYRPYIR